MDLTNEILKKAYSEIVVFERPSSQISAKLIEIVERQQKALRKIANGNYDEYSANPSQWITTIAGKALGWEWKDGKRIK